MSTVAVGIRFEREVWARHSAAAQARGLPLGTYIRQMLEEHEQVATALADIRASLERSVGEKGESSVPPALQGAILEMLLMLRMHAGVATAKMARAEVERQGLMPWILREPCSATRS